MIFSSPLPQFGQCCMSMSKTRSSSRAQLMRPGRPWAVSVSTSPSAAAAAAALPGVRALLPMLQIPPLPCWLAVHREIRGNRVVKRVYDFLAEAIPRELQRTAVT